MKQDNSDEIPHLPDSSDFTIAPPRASRCRSLLGWWMRRLFGCNPFYLASAALLLYGVYRISIDGSWFLTELRQLGFNFVALQVYELLLVITAVFLARRRIWYDSSLLVALENLLWIVPFILISQAAFITPTLALTLCLVAVILAAGRVGWLRTRAGDILPPLRVLWCALPILLVNAAWPVVYHHFGESKIGINITAGAAYDFNELNWSWLLPILAGGLIVLPGTSPTTGPAPMRKWFPLLLFSFWLTGTGVHLYSLGYVYDFQLRREQLAPVLWVLAWGLHLRLAQFVRLKSGALRSSLLFLPLLATGPAVLVAESHTFLVLSILNLLVYLTVIILERERRWVIQLALASCFAAVVSLPVDFAPILGHPVSRSTSLGLALLAYTTVGCFWSRSPKKALLGAIAAMTVVSLLRETDRDWYQWGIQFGCGYLLLHSLRWREAEHSGAPLLRYATLVAWLLHSFAWAQQGNGLGVTLSTAGILGTAWTIRGLLQSNWDCRAVPLTALLVALCHPVQWVALQAKTAPVGVLYLAGSLVLFGMGTGAALIKHRWLKHPPS